TTDTQLYTLSLHDALPISNAVKAKVKVQVMDALIASHSTEVPKALVANEIQVLRNQMLQRFGGQQQNFDVKSLLPDTMFQEEATDRKSTRLNSSHVKISYA